uniref:Uncharacterized protein n=1 Tax=Denticeps clupeoides TaxID=299321 RepID=A0AAY4B1X6_9TELE
MNRTKAAALSLLVGVLLGKVAEAAVLGASKRSFPADDDGQSRRRNATGVHVPSYMLSRGTNRSASTVTSFTDLGKDHPSTDSRQRYIFDLSSLSRADEVVEAELRIFWKPPGDLSVCSQRMGVCTASCCTPVLPRVLRGSKIFFGSRTIDILDTERPQWDVFDVSPSVKALHSAHRNSTMVTALFRSSLALDIGVQEGVAAATREGPVGDIFSWSPTKESLFREIREKMKAAESGRPPELAIRPRRGGSTPAGGAGAGGWSWRAAPEEEPEAWAGEKAAAEGGPAAAGSPCTSISNS